MNAYRTVTDLDKIEAPWRKQVFLQAIAYEGGMTALRMRIKEGSRFTDLELDAATAARIGRLLLDWSSASGGASSAS